MMNVEQAAAYQLKLASREINPCGFFDKAGRWFPSIETVSSASIRQPSRAFPYSLMVHCRTAKYIAQVQGIDLAELKKEIKRQKKGN